MRILEPKLVEDLAAKLGITLTESERFIKTFKHYVGNHLKENNTVMLHGFGQFYSSNRAPRLGMNPRTKAKITIPSVRVPSFKAGEALKKTIN